MRPRAHQSNVSTESPLRTPRLVSNWGCAPRRLSVLAQVDGVAFGRACRACCLAASLDISGPAGRKTGCRSGAAHSSHRGYARNELSTMREPIASRPQRLDPVAIGPGHIWRGTRSTANNPQFCGRISKSGFRKTPEFYAIYAQCEFTRVCVNSQRH